MRLQQSIALRLDNSGFSLLELLLSMAILSVLASIVIPQVSVYRKRAYNAVANQLRHDYWTAMHAMPMDGELDDDEHWFYHVPHLGVVHSDGLLSEIYSFVDSGEIDPELYVSLRYDETCDNVDCWRYFVASAHCRGDQYYIRGYKGSGSYVSTAQNLNFSCAGD